MNQTYYQPGEPTPEEIGTFTKKTGKEKLQKLIQNVDIRGLGDLGVLPLLLIGKLLLAGGLAYGAYELYQAIFGGSDSGTMKKVKKGTPWFVSALGMGYLSSKQEGRLKKVSQIAALGLGSIGAWQTLSSAREYEDTIYSDYIDNPLIVPEEHAAISKSTAAEIGYIPLEIYKDGKTITTYRVGIKVKNTPITPTTLSSPLSDEAVLPMGTYSYHVKLIGRLRQSGTTVGTQEAGGKPITMSPILMSMDIPNVPPHSYHVFEILVLSKFMPDTTLELCALVYPKNDKKKPIAKSKIIKISAKEMNLLTKSDAIKIIIPPAAWTK